MCKDNENIKSNDEWENDGVEEIINLANNGDVSAQYDLGLCYQYGQPGTEL